MLALRRGLADGTIDTVGTDHAPHTEETKQCEWVVAAMGMTGLETALPVIQHTMVDTGLIGWHDVARVMSANPSRIYRHTDQGQLTDTGGWSRELWRISPSTTRHISSWSTRQNTIQSQQTHPIKTWNYQAKLPTCSIVDIRS